jgi:Flp pilus assembly protein TadG
VPILLLTITGIFSFSTVIYQKLLLTEAVASGGRVMAADRGDLNPCATVAAAIAAAAPSLNGLTYSFSINGGTATGATCAGAAGANNMTAGGTASVGAQYSSCTLKAYKYTFPGCVISSQIVEEVQ